MWDLLRITATTSNIIDKLEKNSQAHLYIIIDTSIKSVTQLHNPFDKSVRYTLIKNPFRHILERFGTSLGCQQNKNPIGFRKGIGLILIGFLFWWYPLFAS